MTDEITDVATVGASDATAATLNELSELGHIDELSDGYRLGIAVALSFGRLPRPQARKGRKTMLSVSGLDPDGAIKAAIREIYPEHPRAGVVIEPEAVTYVSSAALDRRVSERREKSYPLKLELTRSRLGLTRPELARLIGVSREGLRQWERGAPISPDRWPIIDKSFDAVNGLLAFVKPEALPGLIRRRLKALNNASPLDWLMSQRHDELRKFYEVLFGYASTD